MFFIYAAANSKACDRAEFILHTIGYDYRIYILGIDYTISQLERIIPGVKTVPQIYHGTKYIGGVKELYEFLQSSENFNNGEVSKLGRVEGMLDRPFKDQQNSSGIHESE